MSKVTARILSKDEINTMKGKIETILSAKGVTIDHPKVLKLLENAGAEVDAETGNVKFPKPIIDEALKRVPKEFTLAAVDPKNDLKFPHPDGLFYTRTCTGGMYYLNEKEEYHLVTPDEVSEWIKLVNSLENINFCALPSTSGECVPAETIDIHTLRNILEHTKKHVWVQPYDAENVTYLLEMAAARAGGREELKKRPIISFITCSVPGFQYKYMDMEAILKCCEYGVPIQPCSLPTAGANTPVTLQGTALMASTEVLAQIIIAELLAPGLPVIATPLLFSMDMKTTYTLQSPVEVTMGRMIAMQIFEEGYGIYAHSYGSGTDSFILDGQSMIERTSLSQMLALSGASVVGGAGQIEVAMTISPVQLIIDNEIFGMVKTLKRGLEINDDALAWDEVMALDKTKSFIDSEHTFAHFREMSRTKLFNRDSRPNWEKAGKKDLNAKAKETYEEIKKKYQPIVVPGEILQAMDEVVKAADKKLNK
ncbi:MAG: trimethylamine methyltransferase family protein [Veillonellales bacterium]